MVFCSDGEPNLDSAEFNQFLADNIITRCNSLAGYPQSNGAAERAVQSFKRLYAKKEIGGILWEGAWALWRHTPRARAVIALPSVVWTPHPTSAVVFVVQPRYVG